VRGRGMTGGDGMGGERKFIFFQKKIKIL
jgi:hypothetical protein